MQFRRSYSLENGTARFKPCEGLSHAITSARVVCHAELATLQSACVRLRIYLACESICTYSSYSGDPDYGFVRITAALLSAASCLCSARLPSLHGLHHADAFHACDILPSSQLENSALGFNSWQWLHFQSPLESRTHVLHTRCDGVRQALSENAAWPCSRPHFMHSFSSGFAAQTLQTR